MRLRSLHPGVSVGTVRESTGFELLIPSSVPATQAPSAEELHVLRTRVDAAGLLRR
jgi:glutaconate CoA-transferase subunit B